MNGSPGTVSALALVTTAALASAGLAQPSFQGLGTLPMPGGPARLEVANVTADGSVITGRVVPPGNTGPTTPFRWTASGGPQVLGPAFGQPDTYASGVSSDAATIVGYTGGTSSNHAFRWSQSQGFTELAPLPGDEGAIAGAISRDGSITAGGSYLSTRGYRIVRWSPSGTAQDLGTLPGDYQAYMCGMSGDGSTIVGWSQGPDGVQAFRTNAVGAMMPLWPLPSDNGIATAASYDGSFIAGERYFGSQQSLRAFRWSISGAVDVLGTLPGDVESNVSCISDDGMAVAGISGFQYTWRAFYWRPDLGMVDLNALLPQLGVDLTGWSLRFVDGMSADGRTLVGSGMHNGASESWIATIPPPASSLLLLGAVICFSPRRVRPRV